MAVADVDRASRLGTGPRIVMFMPEHPTDGFDVESVRALSVARVGVVGEVRHTNADDAFSVETREIAEDRLSQAILHELHVAGWVFSRR